MDRFKQLVAVLSILAAIGVVNGLVSNACYGTDPRCDFYTIRCDYPNVIKLNNLYAGYKSNETCHSLTQHCSNSEQCCTLDPSDLKSALNLENTYNTYTNCSGRQYCDNIHAPWQLMNNSRPSTFVQMEYLCESATDKLPMCGAGVPGTYRGVDIVFNGSIEAFDAEKASKECKCTISNIGSAQTLVFTIIDVRMESYSKATNEGSAKCSSANFTSAPFNATCKPSGSHHKDNFFYDKEESIYLPEGGSTELTLSGIHNNRMQSDSPSMIWVNVKRLSDGRFFTVNCKEVLPADLTTTTTTTTTPTTTTTTSTTTTTTPTTTTPTTTTTTPTTTTTTPTTTTTTPTTTTTTPTTTTTTSTTTTTMPTTTTTTSTTTTTTPTTTTTTPTTTTTTPTTTTATTTTTPTTTTTTPTTTTTTPTTTTTQRPATTTTEKITTPTTTQTTTTTTTTTPVPITSAPTSESTTDSTSVPMTAPTGGQAGDGQEDDQQRMEVYVAIFVPIAVGILVIVLFLLWIYWKKTTPIKDKFHLAKHHPGSDVYKTLSDVKILDNFIRQQGIRSGTPSVAGSTVKLPLNPRSVVSVPSIRPGIRAHDYEKKITEKYVPMAGSTYSTEKLPIQPYTIPIHVTKQNPIYSAVRKPAKQQQPTVYHVKLGSQYSSNASEPRSYTSEEPVVKPSEKKHYEKVEAPSANYIDKPTHNREDITQHEGVVIHVDNLSIPPDSSRSNKSSSPPSPKSSSKSASTSTRSIDGSVAGTSTVEDQPAVTSAESDVERSDDAIRDITPDEDGTFLVRF